MGQLKSVTRANWKDNSHTESGPTPVLILNIQLRLKNLNLKYLQKHFFSQIIIGATFAQELFVCLGSIQMSSCQRVHHFVPDWNINTVIKWITQKFYLFLFLLRMNCINLINLFTFHPAPSSGQNVLFSNTFLVINTCKTNYSPVSLSSPLCLEWVILSVSNTFKLHLKYLAHNCLPN